MGKKRKLQTGTETRPETASSAAELYAQDHERYHGQNAGLQRDMAVLAVTLLGLQGPSNLLADLGCGSGLSAAALCGQAGVGGWLGTDITPEMVSLAARAAGGMGRVAISDFGQGLPLRSAILDGAISVSAVQWLCSAADPPASMRRFFAGLCASLRPGARAALQVYPRDDGQAQQLVQGALLCGLDAGFFVSFPHSTAAKKYFVLVQRPSTEQAAGQGQAALPTGTHLSRRCCNLAWPKSGTCVLSWLRTLPAQADPARAESLMSPCKRMQQEHAGLGKRMVRLLRRAVALSEQGGSTDNGGSGGSIPGRAVQADGGSSRGEQEECSRGASGASGSGSVHSVVIQAELEAQHDGLMPCGGPVFVHLTAVADVLADAPGSHASSRSSGGAPSGSQRAAQGGGGAHAQPKQGGTALAAAVAAGAVADSGPSQADVQQYAGAVEAAAKLLLGLPRLAERVDPASSSAAPAAVPGAVTRSVQPMRHTLLRPASDENAAAHLSHQRGQPFSAPPQGGEAAKALRFMRLEPLEAVQGAAAGLGAAVLHAHKMSPHLVLRVSCATASTCRWCSGGSGGGSSKEHTSSSGGGSAHRPCTSCVASRVAALCTELYGCVVGVDAHLFRERVDATWTLFVAGLQQAERAELAAAVLRHLDYSSTAT